MGTSPIGSSSSGVASTVRRPQTRSRDSGATEARDAANEVTQANSEAADQISRTEQAVQDAQNESNIELGHIRDGFDQEQSNQSEKNDEALQKQRLKGYEELRDLKLRQQAELHRVRREGESTLKKTSNYYRDALYNNSRHDEEALRQQQTSQAREMQYLQKTGQGDLTTQKQDTALKMEALQNLQEQRVGELTHANDKEYERMKTNSQQAQAQESVKFQQEYDAVLGQDRQAIDNLQNNASQQLSEIRQDTSTKLAAYSSRQADPFYKMHEIDAHLHDRGDSYVLTARVPIQEQSHISATVRGNQLVVSGNRRNQEHLSLAPGRTEGTSSYQSYEESFPLNWPVDRNLLTKEFHGDLLIITVPKATHGNYEVMYKPPEPERVRAERPDFPGNLPVPEELSTDSSSGSNSAPPGRKPVSGHTLS